MDLYIVYQFGTENVLGAYWGDSLSAVMDAYKTDGINPDYASSFGATTAQAALYHGPDFDGRKAYWVIPLDGSEPFGIAADTVFDAVDFAYNTIGSNNYAMSPVPLTREEADACLGPGWDQ